MADTKTVSCSQCAAVFQTPANKAGRQKRFCSDRCRWLFSARQRPKITRLAAKVSNTCVQCGTLFEADRKKKICGEECKRARALEASRKRKGSIPLDERKALRRSHAQKACALCGQSFLPTNYTKDGEQQYCSRECAANRTVEQTAKRRLIEKEAATYRKWAMGYGRGIHRHRFRRWRERASQPCIDCGCPVGVARTKTYPASRCGSCAAKERNRQSRISGKKREARLRGVTVEAVDPIKVFERDGWRCYLCGCETPKGKRGTYDDDAPELEHIIPVSRGGEHSYANTACSCRSCNAAKGDLTVEEFRTIAA